MKNIAIVNGLKLSSFAYNEIASGKNAPGMVSEYAGSIPGVEESILLLPEGPEDGASLPGFTCRRLSTCTLHELMLKLQELSEGYENIFYFYADCPFLDSELTERMFKNHQKYFADYTFADGYPYGLSPEILRPKVLKPLQDSATGCRAHGQTAVIKRDSIFELIKKDINAFDIETEIAPSDLRVLRISLSADSKRNFLLLKRIYEHGGKTAVSICNILKEKPEIQHTLPALFSIQIVEGCPQLCTYCPYPKFSIKSTGKKDEMRLSKFESLIHRIEDFCDDAVISISLWGEPSYHSNIMDIILSVLNRKHLRLFIETSCVGWNSNIFYEIAKRGGKSPDWIVSLDANTPEMYGQLRGPQFDEACAAIEILLTYFPGHVYVQAVRMKSNEEDLESFYRQWKKKTGNVIIQKYDHFCGYLPERKVTDLSPLVRFPCWHIKRDVNIYIDGRVPLCREDVNSQYNLGNVFSDDLEEIWSKMEKYYLAHLKKDYPEICKKCDEYYTFNF